MINSDVVIVGAGVMGSSIARELSKYEVNVIMVEKNFDVCFSNISKASNAWVHAGIGFPGKLANKLFVPGNKMLDKLCEELEIPFRRTGELFVAMTEKVEEVFKDFKSQGLENGVEGMRILDKNELKEVEPNLTKKAKSGLFASLAGTISPWELMYAQVENAQENGVKTFLSEEVRNITKDSRGKLIVETTNNDISTRFVINSAGLWVDTIANMVGDKTFNIVTRKSQLLISDKLKGNLVNNIIFNAGLWVEPYLGGCVGPSAEGNLLITGPDEEINSKIDMVNDRDTLEKMISFTHELFPEISSKDIIRYFTGVRALNSLTDDFIIEPSKMLPQLINVQVSSPGITCCQAIAKLVVEILTKQDLNLVEKSNFNPYRKAITKTKELSDEKKKELIKKDPRYGHIICRCEHVSEGEIVEAIKRGARSIDGVKYRTRAGMGRCQGGFCSTRVLKILSRELNLPVESITKKGENSEFVLFKTKELLTAGRVKS